ncbi:LCP family protein [Candidatus Saccharibacteria bacterium]|nr:LCP family protein [Candidatus Saccharibacteria bacterium]
MDKNFQSPRRPMSQRVSIDGFSTGSRPVSRPVIRLDREFARRGTVRPMQSVAANPADNAPQIQPVQEQPAITRQAPVTNNVADPRPLPRLNMELPGSETGTVKHPVFRLRLGILRHWAFRASVGALILILVTGLLLFTQGFFSAQKVFKGGAHAAALQANVNPNLLKGEGDGRINILLLGNGGPGHDGPDLTDTMMVASVDPVNGSAVLLSVPRDLWVAVPGYGNMKINAAYAMGKYKSLGKWDASNSDTAAVRAGFKTADQVVEEVLGIDIHYNMVVNFSAFKKGVDAVGGITVNVPEQLYDRSMAWENHWNPVLAKAGIQEFDGKKALLYVRSRHSSSDFARSERQRAVIVALKQKAVSLGTLSNPLKISQLMNAFGSNVVTDLSLNDAARLYQLTQGIASDHVRSVGLTDEANPLVTTGRVGNQSIVKPLAGLFDYKAIHLLVRKELPDGYIVKENSPITIYNGTHIEGLATSVGQDLKSYGYNVRSVANAPTKTYQQTILVDLTAGKATYTKHYLEQRFGVKATQKLPSTIQNDGSRFILILGSDETSSQ